MTLRFILILTTLVITSGTVVQAAPQMSLEQIDAILRKVKNPELESNTCERTSFRSGCTELFDEFCSKVYSNDDYGNYSFGSDYRITDGDSPNGQNATFVEYSKAKIKAIRESRFPSDFSQELGKEYVENLEKVLASKPKDQMTVSEFNEYTKNLSHASTTYNEAIQATFRNRVEKIYPGYYNDSKTYSTNVDTKVAQLEDKLQSELFTQIWDPHPSMQKAKIEMEQVRSAFIELLKENRDLTDEKRTEFISLISTVKLVTPGSDPEHLDLECANEEKNAAYSPATNSIVICGGYLASANTFFGTFSHEFAHALGLSRARLNQFQNSRAGKDTKALIQNMCNTTPRPACPSDFRNYDTNIDSGLAEIATKEPPFQTFKECLSSKKDKLKLITSEALNEISEKRAIDTVGEQADGQKFLRMLDTKKGSPEKNDYYFNPCAGQVYFDAYSYHPGSNLHARAYFAAQVACSLKPGAQTATPDQMKFALAKTQQMLIKVQKTLVNYGGSLSNIPELQNRYGETVEEAYADEWGSRVFNKVMENKFLKLNRGADATQAKRDFFFANRFRYCSIPGKEKRHPDLAETEKLFAAEEHPLNHQRMKTLIDSKTAEALNCKIDFKRDRCELKP